LSGERDKPIDPVPELPVEMGYGNDNNGVMIDPVDHVIHLPLGGVRNRIFMNGGVEP